MILWLRHGQSTWNVVDRLQGQAAHPPLTELGLQQAADAAERLVDRGVTRVVSSPAVRATQTADVVAARLGLPVEQDPLLVEMGLDEAMASVLGRVRTILDTYDTDGSTTLVVGHGDVIALAVGLLSGTRPAPPANCSITSVDPETRAVTVS